ncbi:hypothetical protein FDENT_285 [Fusarium denticulatum]|uniref:Uncharacterized protein n=1 Tax=Fusarium denticulatum TaxID=48507 RepID=A0A8H5XKL5_9HYPO|nr:hypothetical protein FDENT_285 [Fusarium denticulatum]
MHLLYFLLFMFNLATATPAALGDSSLDSFFNSEDEGSVSVVDDPTFFDLGNANTRTQKKHEKRAGPPYRLGYSAWNVTFERRTGDAWDFKKPGWIFVFPAMSDRQGSQQNPSPWDIVVAPGRIPLPLMGPSNGELWYTTNSYFIPFMRGAPPVATRRTYTQYTSWRRTGSGFQFNIVRTKNDELARENSGARLNIKDKPTQPTSGYIALNFNTNLTGVVNFSSGSLNYNANITGTLVQQGKIWV